MLTTGATGLESQTSGIESKTVGWDEPDLYLLRLVQKTCNNMASNDKYYSTRHSGFCSRNCVFFFSFHKQQFLVFLPCPCVVCRQ